MSADTVLSGSRFQILTQRLIRLQDGPYYLGMDRNRFNAEVRPTLTAIPTGVESNCLLTV